MCVNAFGQNVDIPDVAFKASLVGNSAININGDDEIQISEALAFSGTINCILLAVSDLTGLEAFTALTTFHLNGALLTSLDVSSNTALTHLICSDNPLLESLDVSSNTALTILSCRNNPLLASLDVSSNTALTSLQCSYNLLLTSLDVSSNTALTTLFCEWNLLTSLDVSSNTALTTLSCFGNLLTSLNLSQNTALQELLCFGNQLTSLDVSSNPELNFLDCQDNQLTSLDVSQNTALEHLFIEGNNLTSLDLSLLCLTNAYLSNPNLFCIQVSNVSCYQSWMIDTTFQYYSEDCTDSVNELNDNNKTLTKVIDALGREVNHMTNQVLFHIYDDGSVEKKFVVE